MKRLIFFFYLLLLSVPSFAQLHYRSAVVSGNWNAIASWQTSPDLITWNAAAVAPASANTLSLQVQAGHTINISASLTFAPPQAITVDGTLTVSVASTFTSAQTMIVNGTLNVSGGNFTLGNGAANPSLINNGTVQVAPTRILTFNAGTTITNNANLLNNGILAINTLTPITNAGTWINQQAAPGSIVRYSGAAGQPIEPMAYYDLEILGASKNLTLSGSILVRNNLTVSLSNSNQSLNIMGSGNSVLINNQLILTQGQLIPAPGVSIVGNSLANTLTANGGILCVTELGANALLTQYPSFETWAIAATNIIRYNGAGDQEITELLPGGIAYGSIDAGGTGSAGVKTLTLTGAMPTLLGNFTVQNPGKASIEGNGVLGVNGNLNLEQFSELNTVSSISIDGVGASNQVVLNNINANMRTLTITKPSLLSQITNFETWNTLSTNVASLIVNFNSTSSLIVDEIPGLGAYREIYILGNRGTNPITFTNTVRVQRVLDLSGGSYGSVQMLGSTLWFEPLSSNFIKPPVLPYDRVDVKPVVSATNACLKLPPGDYTMNSLNVYPNAYVDYNNGPSASSITVNGDVLFDGIGESTAGKKVIMRGTDPVGSFFNIKGNLTCNGIGVMRAFSISNNSASSGIVNLYGNIINTYGVASTDTLILNDAGIYLNLLGNTPKTLSGPATFYVKDNVKVNNSAGWTFDSNVFMVWSTSKDFQILQPLQINTGKNLNSYGATPATPFSHNLHQPANITVGSFATQVQYWKTLTAAIQYVSNTGNDVNNGLTPATPKKTMQKAYNDLAAGGRMILLTNLTDSLTVYKQITIEGQGKATTVLSPPAKPALYTGFADCFTPSKATSNILNYMLARTYGIITFAQGSDSSCIKNIKLAHDNQENRTAIMIMPRVKNIIIDNIAIETSGNGSYKGNASYPYHLTNYSGCNPKPSDTDNDLFGKYVCQVAGQYYSSFRLSNSNLSVTINTVKLDRSVAGYVVGTGLDSVIVENNNIDNDSKFATQCVWFQEVTNVYVRNNTILGSSFSTASDVFGVDISSFNNRFRTPKVYVENNTIATAATHQICFKMCYLLDGEVFARNNIITTNPYGSRLNMGVGIGVEATLKATVEGNVFNAPSTGNYIHIYVDNDYPTAPGLTSKAAPVVNIWGNTFNTNTDVPTAARAIVFRRTELDATKYYQQINLIGSSPNVFGKNVLRYVDIERGLFDPSLGLVTLDMTTQNTFPTFETGYETEDKITHYLDSRRNELEPRPFVKFQNKHFYITAQQAGVGEVINTSFPICNRSVQDALDIIPSGANDYWVHLDAKVFKSGSEMSGGELEYGSNSQVEEEIYIDKPIYFVGRDTFNTVVNRHITVALPSATNQVTQYGCFTFGKDGVGVVKRFTINQGDWNLNTKVIIFAPVNALLVESVGNTIKDNYAKTIAGGIRGYIQTTRTLNAPSGVDVAGFGAVITSSANLGSTLIRRGHNEQILPSPDISVFRYFDIHPYNNSGLNATFTFKYDSSERNNRVEANLKQWRNPNPLLTSNWAEQMTTSAWAVQGGTPGVSSVTFTGINAFSRWTLAEGTTTLPVEQLAFRATLVNEHVNLDWNTQNEQNLAYFEIERSMDLQTFEYIGKTQANGINGASGTYQNKDNQPKKGVSYYRLKLVNIDGSFSYSSVETIVWEDPSFISIYPNPATHQFNIALGNTEETSVTIQMIDIQGKVIHSGVYEVHHGIAQIPTDKIAQGVYVVQVKTSENLSSARLVIYK